MRQKMLRSTTLQAALVGAIVFGATGNPMTTLKGIVAIVGTVAFWRLVGLARKQARERHRDSTRN